MRSSSRLQLIRRNRFARSTAVLAGGVAFGQSLAILVSPLLTRLYSPADFGVLAGYASVVGILSVTASFRYEIAVPLAEDETGALNILTLSILLVGVSALLWGAIVALGLGESILDHAGASSLKPYLSLVPIGVFLIGIYQALNYWAIREASFRLIAKTRIVQAVGSASLQSGLGAITSGPGGLLAGSVFGQAAGGSSLAISLWKIGCSLFHLYC